jgi:arsenate reductase-like glutaredoxin family protein
MEKMATPSRVNASKFVSKIEKVASSFAGGITKPSFTRAVMLVALFVVWATPASAQEVYKVVGPDGKVTYTSTPPEDAKKVSTVRMDVAAPDASKAPPPAPKSADAAAKKPPVPEKDFIEKAKDWAGDVAKTVKSKLPGATGASAAGAGSKETDAAPNKDPHFGQPILFYKMIGCAKCDEARRYLRDRKIAYRGLDVGTEDGRRAMAEMDKSAALPLLIARGKKYTGFSADSYDEILRDYNK